MVDHQSADGLLGPLEYEVMRALWEDSPSNVSGVLARMNETRPKGERIAYTTAMTVLSRLHDKGILGGRERGRGYSYEPRFRRGSPHRTAEPTGGRAPHRPVRSRCPGTVRRSHRGRRSDAARSAAGSGRR